jgi:fatty-acyl-CoA synthase
VRIHRRPEQVPYISKLDPLQFLLRSAMIYAHKTAIIHRNQSYTYLELSERVKALANVLIDDYQVKPGDRVAILSQNITCFVDAQFAIPAIGAICVPMNTRLAAKELEYILEHSGASILIVQQELMDHLTEKSKSLLKAIIEVADCDDPRQDPYERLLASSKHRLSWNDLPTEMDENATISINYTSGSTGRPKGVMVSYRGAYMMALGMAIHDSLSPKTVFLWTLPMFHCNGKRSYFVFNTCD